MYQVTASSEDEAPSASSIVTAAHQLVGLDLYAGAGGFSLAAERVGIRIAAAVEIDRHACRTYRRNFIDGKENAPKLFETDVRSITGADLLQATGLKAGYCSIVIGGPPCQGFSAHRINDAGVGDPRNDLLIRYFELVDTVRPAAFLVENVPGMLWERHRDYVKRFYELAREAGYDPRTPEILNARDYGVPQNRKRVFILGTRRDLDLDVQWPPTPTHGDPDSIDVHEGRRQSWVVAAAVFDKPLPKNDPNDLHMRHSEALRKVFEATRKDGGSRSDSGRMLPCHDGHTGHSDVYGRIALSKPGPTMTTACINPSKGRFVHPTKDHGITLRQAARFQTFPDDFFFEGGLMAGGAQIGNAVPIELGMAVLKPVTAALTTVAY